MCSSDSQIKLPTLLEIDAQLYYNYIYHYDDYGG